MRFQALVLNLLWRRCGADRTAQKKCALDNAFSLIEGHPPKKNGRPQSGPPGLFTRLRFEQLLLTHLFLLRRHFNAAGFRRTVTVNQPGEVLRLKRILMS